MSRKSTRVQLFVGKRQTGKTTKATALVHEFIANHPEPRSMVYVGAPNKVMAKEHLKLFQTYALQGLGDKLRVLNVAPVEKTMLPYWDSLSTLAQTSEKLCFYLIDVKVAQLEPLMELIEEYPHHEWIIEIYTNRTDAGLSDQYELGA